MRSKSGFILLIIIFIVLLVLVLGRTRSQERALQEQQAEIEQLVFPDFNPDAVSHITLTSLQNGVVEFKKEGGYWMVADGGQHPILKQKPPEEDESEAEGETAEVTEEGETDETAGPEQPESGAEPEMEEPEVEPEVELRYYRADETQVIDGILENMGNLERGVVVSHDPEKHSKDFGVSTVLAIEVKAEDYDGNLLADFYVGNASDMMSTSNYIRFPEEDEVYEVKQAWKNLVGRPFTAWRDKALFHFDPVSINRIRLIGTSDGDLGFAKDSEGNWGGEDADWDIDSAKLASLIEKMSGLRAADFARMGVLPEETGLENPEMRVIAEGPEGSYELIIGQLAEAGKYYCTLGDDDTVFMVNEPDIEAILVGRAGLEMTAPPEPEEGAPVE